MPDTPATGDPLDILGALHASAMSINSSVGDLNNILGFGPSGPDTSASAASAAQQSATAASANAQMEINTANEKAAIQLKLDNAKAAAAFGGMPYEAGSLLNTLAEQVTTGEKDLVNRQQMIQSKMDQSFLDDPLQYFTNQFSLPSDIAAYNMKEASLKQQSDVISELQKRTTDAYAINAGIDTGAGEQRLAGMNALALANAAKDVATSKYNLAVLGISALNVRTQLNEQQFNNIVAANGAIINQQKLEVEKAQLGIAQEQLGLAKVSSAQHAEELSIAWKKLYLEQHQMDINDANLALAEKAYQLHVRSTVVSEEQLKVSQDSQKLAMDAYLFGQAKFGIEQQNEAKRYGLDLQRFAQSVTATDEQLRISRANLDITQHRSALENDLTTLNIEVGKDNQQAKNFLQLKLDRFTSSIGANRIMVQQYQLMPGNSPMRQALDEGMNDPAQDATGGASIAFTPAEAVNRLNQFPGTGTAGMNLVRKSLIETMNGAETAQGQLWATMRPDMKMLAYNTAIAKAANVEARNIPDSTGIYSPPPLMATLAIPKVAALPIVDNLNQLAKNNSQYPTKADDIWIAGTRMIQEGKATPAEVAAQISTIYNAINVDNTQQRQYNRFSLQGQTNSFNTSVHTGSNYLGGSEVVNMASPAEVENKLTRALAVQKAYGYGQNVGTGSYP